MWAKHFYQLVQVGIGVRQADHIIHALEFMRCKLSGDRPGVVDDMIRTQFLDPLLAFSPGGGTDHRQLGKLAGKLDQDGTHPAGSADHQQALPLASLLCNAQAVEQQLPSGDGGQRQRRSISVIQTTGLVPDDTLVNYMQLAVAARAVDGAGVEHFVAGPEQRHFRAHLAHNPDSVPAKHLWLLAATACPYFRIDRVYRNGLDLDQ